MRARSVLAITAMLIAGAAYAHVDGRPSIHDTLQGIVNRWKSELDAETLGRLSERKALEFITEEEREILGSELISFDVNVPVVVYVIVERGHEPFWLEDKGYEKTEHKVEIFNDVYEAWAKEHDPGRIGLGVNNIDGNGDMYFAALDPVDEGDSIQVSGIYPGQHNVVPFALGEDVYVDQRGRRIGTVSEGFEPALLLQTIEANEDIAQLVNRFRVTEHPSSGKPDHVVLTWSGDPATTQTIQWRTDTTIAEGRVEYRQGSEGSVMEAAAVRSAVSDPELLNDPECHRFTVTLRGLEPDTTYSYRVGTGSDDGWTEWTAFTTAPDGPKPFSFIYMGDAQNGLDTWGVLAHKSFEHRPDVSFYVMAGDLVNRGIQRDDWDKFFHNATGIYDRRQLIPAIGNHEDQGRDGPWMYLDMFDLPDNGPDAIDSERAYSLEYSNAIFIILDSNLSPSVQEDWLEEQLANTDATWKFVVYHHPAYSSSPNRNNPLIREHWTPLFDKYHVDLAMQGHDHAYLRTFPMYDQKPMESPDEGTIYVVSVSGTKYYDQGDFDYKAVGMTNTSTYQVLDIVIDGNTLTYKAYDVDGKLRDEFVIKK